MEKFSYEANGYNRKEVQNFVNDVIIQTEGIIKKCKSQKKELDYVKKELEHYKELDATLQNAIIKAESTGENIKRLAKEESEIIISNAKNNADRIVNDALIRAKETEQKTELLENNMKVFKRKLKLILQQEQAVVDEIEILELE